MATGTRIVFGLHAARHVLERAPARVLEGWLVPTADAPRLEALRRLAAGQGITLQPVPRRTLDRLTAGGRHQGVALRVRALAPLDHRELMERVTAAGARALVLALDGVEDPRNVGACIRTADGAGATAVVLPRSRGAGLTPAAFKVASGALETTPVALVANLARTLAALAECGLTVIGTDAGAPRTLYEEPLDGAVAWVLGGEGAGLRRLTRERCDRLVRIPLHGGVESLNVSVAAGVCLYETVRQRLQPTGEE